jgi:hypothetical protein
MNDNLADDEQKIIDLSNALRELEPGFLPYRLFEQIARLIALPILEFIPLRLMESGIEVLLIGRPDDDPFWPGLLHTPGTVIRATDIAEADEQTNWPAFKRIGEDELHDTEIGPPHYVGSLLHKSKRGAEQAQLYWVEVVGEPKVGTFYPVDALPIELMDSQVAFIIEAARHFGRR